MTVVLALAFASQAIAADPGKIAGYVTPWYDSSGPVIKVGKFSSGLASKSRTEFVATIQQMKKQWGRLSFPELYVGAIRLYDLGYRKEATYWFYTAQYRGRQFGLLVDQGKLGGIGDPGFELYHAQDAFFEVVGPQINGYAYGDIDTLVPILRRVQNENRSVPDLRSIYPGVAFTNSTQWQSKNDGLNAGLGKLASTVTDQKNEIAQQRVQNGTQARFANVTSKQFPGGL